MNQNGEAYGMPAASRADGGTDPHSKGSHRCVRRSVPDSNSFERLSAARDYADDWTFTLVGSKQPPRGFYERVLFADTEDGMVIWVKPIFYERERDEGIEPHWQIDEVRMPDGSDVVLTEKQEEELLELEWGY